MSKVICTHKDLIPQVLQPDVDYFSMYRTEGRRSAATFSAGHFAFALSDERRQFEGVVASGFAELGALLSSHGIL